MGSMEGLLLACSGETLSNTKPEAGFLKGRVEGLHGGGFHSMVTI